MGKWLIAVSMMLMLAGCVDVSEVDITVYSNEKPVSGAEVKIYRLYADGEQVWQEVKSRLP